MLNYKNIFLSLAVCILFIFLLVIIFKKLSKHRKFNYSARTHNETNEPQYQDNDENEKEKEIQNEKQSKTIDLGIARANDEIFDSWLPIQELMKEIGIRRIINNMIEYSMDDGTRTFVGIAKMQQSNPFLKTQEERNVDMELQEVFLNGLEVHTKISSQHQRTDMSNFFQQQKNIITNSKEPLNIQQQGLDIIKSAEEEEENINRFTNVAYVQFIVNVTNDDVFGDNTKEIENDIYDSADTKINQAILKANQALSSREHELTRLSNYELIELIYKTFNRDTAKVIPFDHIIREQKFSLFTTASNDDEEVQSVREYLQALGKTKVQIKHDKHIKFLKEKLEKAYQEYTNACRDIQRRNYQDIKKHEREKLAQQLKDSEKQLKGEK